MQICLQLRCTLYSFAVVKKILSRLGFAASVLCTVHCLATPVLVLAAPMAGHYLEGMPYLETALIALSVLSAVFILWGDAVRKHKQWFPAIIGSVGVILLVLGHMHEGEPWHSLAMIGGGLFMTLAFWRNYTATRKHHTCQVHA